MVKISFAYIDKIEDIKTRLEHIKTIKDVCEKKIFLEVNHHIFISINYNILGRICEMCTPFSQTQ